jgi:hypothetical protein
MLCLRAAGPFFLFRPSGHEEHTSPYFLAVVFAVVVVLITLKYKSKDNNKGLRRENA